MNLDLKLRDPVIVLRLRGHVPSKKNRWRPGKGGKIFIPAEDRFALDALEIQARIQWANREPILHPILVIQQDMPTQNPDIDNRDTALLDVLVRAGVLENDNPASLNAWRLAAPAWRRDEESTVIAIYDHIEVSGDFHLDRGVWPQKRRRSGAASRPRTRSPRGGETTTVLSPRSRMGGTTGGNQAGPANSDTTPKTGALPRGKSR